jgi:hypothetical protein
VSDIVELGVLKCGRFGLSVLKTALLAWKLVQAASRASNESLVCVSKWVYSTKSDIALTARCTLSLVAPAIVGRKTWLIALYSFPVHWVVCETPLAKCQSLQ